MSETKRNRGAAGALAIALAGATAVAAVPCLGGERAGARAANAQSTQKGKNKKAAETTGVLVDDRGTLEIQVNGQKAGSEEFEIRQSGGEWTARGTAEVAAAKGGTSKVTGKLTLTADGAPVRYEWTVSNPKQAGAIAFEGTVAKLEMKMEGAAPYAQEFRFDAPPVIILDNNMYHQYAVLARLYDWEHKEPKTYAVLIPQDPAPGSVTAEYAGQQMVDGQKMDLLRVRSTDLEIELYCDPERQERLVRLEVPTAKAAIVRQAGKK